MFANTVDATPFSASSFVPCICSSSNDEMGFDLQAFCVQTKAIQKFQVPEDSSFDLNFHCSLRFYCVLVMLVVFRCMLHFVVYCVFDVF